MLGSVVLETAIGLIFVYLIFSLIASAIAEYVSALFDRRGEHLKHILFNLFDNDDPQGRTILNLFVAHPTVQALNSTQWKPTFQSASERLGEQKQELKLAKIKWKAASDAVATAVAARDAAWKADDCATRAMVAVSGIDAALKTFIPLSETSHAELQNAIATAQTVAEAAETAADAADRAAKAAIAAAEALNKIRAPHPKPSVGPAPGPTSRNNEPDRSSASSPAVTPVQSREVPAPEAIAQTFPTAIGAPSGDLPALARAAADRSSQAAKTATEAANTARKAAVAAEKAKKGLDSDLIDLVSVPKYIPDRIFVDVLLHVLTADETIEALSPDEGAEVRDAAVPDMAATPFWDRFAAALKVVVGVARRLPDDDVKGDVNRGIAAIQESLRLVGDGTAKAMVILARLESGTDELRAAIAAVPDDALRASLEHEVDNSLRPLHELGRDILILQRAGQAVAMMADSSIKTALSAFIGQAGQDIEAFKMSVCAWFNDVMDHASGWYKRNTQRILVVIAVILCAANNVDTISLVGHLSTDPEMRAAAAKEAREFLDRPGSAGGGLPRAPGQVPNASPDQGELASRYKSAVEATTLPLWWTKAEWSRLLYTIHYVESQVGLPKMINHESSPAATLTVSAPVYRFSPNYSWLLAKFTGLLISILAVSMGAPFWFDLLNKLVNVRLAGKRPDPSDATGPPAPSRTRAATPMGQDR